MLSSSSTIGQEDFELVPNPPKLSSSEKVVMVSGGGPGALASAWEAASAGKRVIVVCDRDLNFTRSQPVKLDTKTIRYLSEMIATRKIERYSDYQIVTQLSDEKECASGKFYLQLQTLEKGKKLLQYQVRSPTGELKTGSIDDSQVPNLKKLENLKTLSPEILNQIFDITTQRNHTIDNPDWVFLHGFQTTPFTAIRDIENFIKRRIEERFKEKLTFLLKSEITAINMADEIVSIGPSKMAGADAKADTISYRVQTLIGADGAKHHAATVLNANRRKALINYIAIACPEHPYHAFIRINLTLPNDHLHFSKEGVSYIESVHVEGGKDFRGGIRFDFINSNKDGVQCAFTGEIPQEIFKSIVGKNQTQHLIDYIKRFVNNCFPDFKGQLKVSLLEEKNVLSVFTTNDLTKAETAAIEDPNSHMQFFLVGDAYRKPNYQRGHGLVDALMHAQQLGKVMRLESTLEQYNKVAADLSSQVERGTTLNKLAIFFFGKDRIAKTISQLVQKDKKAVAAFTSALAIPETIDFSQWLQQALISANKNYKGKHGARLKELNKLVGTNNILKGVIREYCLQVLASTKKIKNFNDEKLVDHGIANLTLQDFAKFAKSLTDSPKSHTFSWLLATILRTAKLVGIPLYPLELRDSLEIIIGDNVPYLLPVKQIKRVEAASPLPAQTPSVSTAVTKHTSASISAATATIAAEDKNLLSASKLNPINTNVSAATASTTPTVREQSALNRHSTTSHSQFFHRENLAVTKGTLRETASGPQSPTVADKKSQP